MDELVSHCLRELAFDGDLGCDVSRLQDFIAGFYEHSLGSYTQTVDDAFCAFVWSLVVQQSTVRVGIVPPGTTSEVYIAPQVSARRKALAKGVEHVEETPPSLDILPDAKLKPLAELRAQYGGELRVAVDPETCFAAITGSHLRPTKLSPMVYSALQLITRGRETGISVVELGKQSKYDQKTCFYLIKQLIELGLVEKIKRGGVGSHFVIHKYFFERNPIWQQIRAEEMMVEEEQQNQQNGQASDAVLEAPEESLDIHFDPIDARHVSSTILIRDRVVRLLKASKNHMHAATNLITTVGVSNPTKTDRRFFSGRLRELVQEGILEDVMVPRGKAQVHCVRLITPDRNTSQAQVDAGENLNDDNVDGVKTNLTIHKQISNMLEQSGTRGMTLVELSRALGQFDKRTIELLLTREAKNKPPSHLGDLGTIDVLETHGRERRHRYFTVAAYQALLSEENLDASSASHTPIDMSAVGGFAALQPGQFWDDVESLYTFQDRYNSKPGAKPQKAQKHVYKNPLLPDGSRKIGRPRKDPSAPPRRKSAKTKTPGESKKSSQKRKREVEDDDPADGGLPGTAGDGGSSEVAGDTTRPSKKRKVDSGRKTREPETPTPAPKGRGRGSQRKSLRVAEDDLDTISQFPHTTPSSPLKQHQEQPSDVDMPGSADDKDGTEPDNTPAVEPTETPVPKARGRPRKRQEPPHAISVEDASPAGPSATETVEPSPVDHIVTPKRSGRLRKQRVDQDDGQDQAVDGAAHPSSATTTPVSQPLEDSSLRRSSRRPKPVFRDDNAISPKKQSPKKPRTSENSATQPNIDQQPTEPTQQPLHETVPVPESPPVAPSAVPPPIDKSPLPTTRNLGREQKLPPQLDACIPIDPALMMEDFASQGVHPGNARVQSSFGTPPSDVGTLKRSSDAPLPLAKRSKADESTISKGRQTKTNVSQLRRENEIFRVIELAGGIAHTHTKEFFEAHTALLNSLVEAKEPTSAPAGTRIDKRTADATLNSLERRGRIKILKTTVISQTGASRPACIVYLPDIEQSKINTFLADLGRSATSHPQPVYKQLEEPLDYGGQTQKQRAALPLQLLQLENPKTSDRERWSRNIGRAEQLFTYDDATVREVLLTERTTVAQLHGFSMGKMTRCRELHLSTLSDFEQNTSSTWVVSHEQRIVNLSYFYHDLPVATYCTLVSTVVHDDELTSLLSTPEGRATPIRDIPPRLHTVLQVGRARSRARFLDILNALRCMKLVTPLQVSTPEKAWLTCTRHGNAPTTFEIFVTDDWDSISPITAPLYWHFNEIAPIHLWALSDNSPPFWKDMPITTPMEATAYWDDLHKVCISRNDCLSVQNSGPTSLTGSLVVPSALRKALRRESSWQSDYCLTWHQRRFLQKHVDGTTGHTPLEGQDAEAQIQRLCWVASAPRDVILEFFTSGRTKVEKELRKAKQRSKHARRKAADAKARKASESTKAQFAKKAAEAKAQKEKSWDDMVRRVHPEPLKGTIDKRVRQLRSRFMSGPGADTQKWKEEINAAILDAQATAAKFVIHPTSNVVPAKAAPPPVVSNPPEKSVDILIAEQGPPLHKQPTETKKQKRARVQREQVEGVASASNVPRRRHRFQWNRDYEELARDANAIIKARCRSLPRLELSALDQVFPGVPRNSVRQRLAQMKETPSTDAYMKRLENQWYHLWRQHRGTDLLPDPDPRSASNFDLKAHIEFLRKHVDKNALRVGYVQLRESDITKIPASVDDLNEKWDIVNTAPFSLDWDFLWTTTHGEEVREKTLLRRPFTTYETGRSLIIESSLDSIAIAESALKMAFGTPNESYDAEVGSRLLHNVGQPAISSATANLLNRGVLSKRVRDPSKPKPGRTLKVSEVNQNALGGSISRDTFQDAFALEEFAAQQEPVWREWPLLASDGDIASLIQLVSEDKVDFRLDTSQAQEARAVLDWNSKKTDDDQIETSVHVRLRDLLNPGQGSPAQFSPAPEPMDLDNEPELDHGIAVSGDIACCRRQSYGPVNCIACLNGQRASFSAYLNDDGVQLADVILDTVRNAGEKGISKSELLVNVHAQADTVFSLVHQMASLTVPLFFWSGYSSLVLVSSEYLQAWSVVVSEDPVTRVFPRRWLNIYGGTVDELWESALKAVIGVITFRPGVSQAELRWRLRSVYDRQEVSGVLHYLEGEAFVSRRVDPVLPPGVCDTGCPAIALDDDAETVTHWFLGTRHWYQVS